MASVEEASKVSERLDEETSSKPADEQAPTENTSDPDPNIATPPASRRASVPKLPDGHSYDAIIAVMGQTGVGKTAFISKLVGRDLNVGHGLISCTQEVQVFDTKVDGHSVMLVDTPGFDDTRRSDADILELISYYLERAFRENIKLTGIIYLQRITDNRVSNSVWRTIRLLKKLVGEDNFNNIALATTMWDLLPEAEIGVRREQELVTTDGFWAELVQRKASVHRHSYKRDSALEIIRSILRNTAMVLQFQLELQKYGELSKTSAGKDVYLYLAKISSDYHEKLNELQKQIKELQDAKIKREEKEKDLEEKRLERERELALLIKENAEVLAKHRQALAERERLNAELKSRLGEIEVQVKERMAANPRGAWPQCPVQ